MTSFHVKFIFRHCISIYFLSTTGLLAALQGKCFYFCSRIFSWNDKEHQQYLSSIASPSGAHQLHIVVPASQCTQQERRRVRVHIAKERDEGARGWHQGDESLQLEGTRAICAGGARLWSQRRRRRRRRQQSRHSLTQPFILLFFR
jgi:hypothetical protein